MLRFRDAPNKNCSEVKLDEHMEHVANRIKEWRLLQKNLRGLRNLFQQTRTTKDSRVMQSVGILAKSSFGSFHFERRNCRLYSNERLLPTSH
jgi:hypothetical protein